MDANVTIEDCRTGAVLGEVNKLDAPPILHPEAIYMHRGDTYRVLKLDLEKNVATVRREDVDYYTQPIGGTDVHHVDHCLREKPFGAGRAFWGEVTAYFRTRMYEKVHFYELDAISRHGLDLPTFVLETMAFWLVPPEELTERVRRANLDVHGGLRGIGYATRMHLPLLLTCDTRDFSHTVGSVNAPWQAVFVYERYRLGQGFTARAFERLGELMPAVLRTIRACPCDEGCPCCVGKPLRGATTWNVERGEGSIPSKAAAVQLLEGLLGDGTNLAAPETAARTDEPAGGAARLERALRRHLERRREPEVFHPIQPRVETEYPEPEDSARLDEADAARRVERKRTFRQRLRKRLAERAGMDGLDPLTPGGGPPAGMHKPGSSRRPTSFPGKPATRKPPPCGGEQTAEPGLTPEPLLRQGASGEAPAPVKLGDSLAARARRKARSASPSGKQQDTPHE